MTDLTVLADLVYSAVDVVWWVGIAAVACSMALLILFASMPAFDWLFATSQRRRTGHKPSAPGNDPQQTATAPNNLRSRQQREEPKYEKFIAKHLLFSLNVGRLNTS